MEWIADGDFIMGSSDADVDAILQQHPDWRADWFAQEKPLRIVSLPGFWIYRDPVTVAQFHACCRETGWSMPAAPEWGWRDDHPMVNVSWADIHHYATWAQAGIPTEAQWEKAARGTDGRIWPWGNTWMPDYCNHTSTTQPVGSHPGNVSPYGVRDMVGNVWEWCQASPRVTTSGRLSGNSNGACLRPVGMCCAVGRGSVPSMPIFVAPYRCFECEHPTGTWRLPSSDSRVPLCRRQTAL